MKKSIVILVILFSIVSSENLVFSQSSGALMNESVLIQTDKDLYISGENLFFSFMTLGSVGNSQLPISNFAYLVLRNNNNLNIVEAGLKLVNKKAYGTFIIPDTLSSGVYQLVGFTRMMRNFGEEAFFAKELIVVNRFDRSFGTQQSLVYASPLDERLKSQVSTSSEIVTITPSKSTFGPREKIKINLRFSGNELCEYVSVSASVREQVPGGITSSLEFPSPSNEIVNKIAEKSRENKCVFFPEINGVIVSGIVKDSKTGNPLPGVDIFLSVPDTFSNLLHSESNSKGEFQFLLNDYYENKTLYFTIRNIENAALILDDKFSLSSVFSPSEPFFSKDLRDFIVKSQSISTVQKAFPSQEIIDHKAEAKTAFRNEFYGLTDFTVRPVDYLSLVNFAEISKEILPGVRLRNKENFYTVNIFDRNSSKYYEESPAFFIDGVLVNKIDNLLPLNSEQITKIEYFTTERYIGQISFPGVLSVFTRDKIIAQTNNYPGQTRVQNISYLQRSGLNSISFDSGEKISSPKPDFRQTLYWNPELKITLGTNHSLEFYASDNIGTYEVVVSGITSQGIRFSTTQLININLPK